MRSVDDDWMERDGILPQTGTSTNCTGTNPTSLQEQLPDTDIPSTRKVISFAPNTSRLSYSPSLQHI